MPAKRAIRRSLVALATLAMILSVHNQSHAQQNAQGGVRVDAEGVLHMQWVDRSDNLHRQRVAAAKAGLDRDVSRKSLIRCVSLTRLEREIARTGNVTDAMRNLAGLTRISYVLCYPETGDIVIAGPAEGWMEDPTGRKVGIHSGRPIAELQDLITALRVYRPDATDSPMVSVSIDPTQEGLAKMQRFLTEAGGWATPDMTERIVRGLKDNLGLQTVTFTGVPTDTHFAQVMLEADYYMKLIAIGLVRPPVRMNTYIAKARPGAVAQNAMKRWYFVPNYDSVRVTSDGLGMELVGQGVKLIGASEVVQSDGTRVAGGKADRASDQFTQSFTKKYDQIAKAVPVFGQLKNLIDMSIVAAFIRQQGYHEMVDWKMEVFGDEQRYPVETYPTPTNVETAVNAVWKGNRLMTPVGGGVAIEAHQALSSEHVMADEEGKVAKQHDEITPAGLAENQWWWD